MSKKIIVTSAIAALAVPASAVADRPEDKPAKPTKPAKSQADKPKKGKAFTLAGVDLSGLNVQNGALAGALTVDPTSANRHARRFLTLSKTELRGEDTVQLGTAGDTVVLRHVGLSATDAVQPTDRVKVVGRVVNGTLDIRRITVKRPETTETTTS